MGNRLGRIWSISGLLSGETRTASGIPLLPMNSLGPSELLLGDLRQVLLSSYGCPLQEAGMGSCTGAPRATPGGHMLWQPNSTAFPHRAWPLGSRTDQGRHCPDAPRGPYCLSSSPSQEGGFNHPQLLGLLKTQSAKWGTGTSKAHTQHLVP